MDGGTAELQKMNEFYSTELIRDGLNLWLNCFVHDTALHMQTILTLSLLTDQENMWSDLLKCHSFLKVIILNIIINNVWCNVT